MGFKSIINKIVWSFSSLNLYDQCPYAFYLHKIEQREEKPNFYSENGTAMHETLAAILQGDISVDEAPQVYLDKFNDISSFVSESTMDKTYESCVNYLCEINPLPDNCEIIGVEMKLQFKIEKYKFIGYADAVIRDKNTNEIWLIDHKSSPHFLKKNGEPLKSQTANFYAYSHQMYLYCYGLKQQYGIQVDHICWHHFRDNGALTIIPFREEDIKDTIDWVLNLIDLIHDDGQFEPYEVGGDNYMMCYQLCDFRTNCEYLLMEDNDEEEEE